MAIGLVACGSAHPAQPGLPAHPAQVTGSASEWTPEADECATNETFVEAGDSALEGVIVDCATGEKISDVVMLVTGITNPMEHGDTISDESGHYRVQLPEGRYRVSVQTLYEPGDGANLEIEIRAQHATVKEIRLDSLRCPPARGGPAVTQADRTALIAAVLDHHAAAGIVDAPKPSDPGPTYVTIKGLKTLALPSNNARQYIVTTEDQLQNKATRSGRDIWFIHIFGLEIAESCATVSVGGDFVDPNPKSTGKMCCCRESEVFARRGSRWVFRVSRGDICF